MTSLEALQTPEQDSGWIKHDGKGMPVERHVLVNVKFRDGGETLPDYPLQAWQWGEGEFGSNWNHEDPSEADIVAYRLHKPSPSSQGEEQ